MRPIEHLYSVLLRIRICVHGGPNTLVNPFIKKRPQVSGKRRRRPALRVVVPLSSADSLSGAGLPGEQGAQGLSERVRYPEQPLPRGHGSEKANAGLLRWKP